MGIFWQHVGDANARRDFPKTLGDPQAGVKEYSIDQIESYIRVESPISEASVRRSFETIGSTTFQLWGFPTGAASVLSKAERGDLFCFWTPRLNMAHSDMLGAYFFLFLKISGGFRQLCGQKANIH